MQIAAFGGSEALRDRGLLGSAIAMPEASFGGEYVHTGIFEKAGAYAFHIAENQPFVDGNKRAALFSGLMFLEIQGYEVNDPDEHLYDAMIALAKRKLGKDGLAKILKSLSTKI